MCVFCDAKNPLDLLCSAVQISVGRLRGPVWRMRRLPVWEITMLKNFDDMPKNCKDQIDPAMEAVGPVSKGGPSISGETSGYAQRAVEEGSAALAKILSP